MPNLRNAVSCAMCPVHNWSSSATGVRSLRRPLLFLILFDSLFTVCVSFTFFILLTQSKGREFVWRHLDVGDLVNRLEGGDCFQPLMSTELFMNVSIRPHNVDNFKGVQTILQHLSDEHDPNFVSLLGSCQKGASLELCLLERTCPSPSQQKLPTDLHLNEDEETKKTLTVRRNPMKSCRFDLMSASAQRIRRGFLRDRSHFTPETIFEPELSFCEALFNYVRLTASPFVTARLAEDYSFNGEEPEEVAHLLLTFMSLFDDIRGRIECEKKDYECLLRTMCDYEIYADQDQAAISDLEKFLHFMEANLYPCLGAGCRNSNWEYHYGQRWFSSCWLLYGGFLRVLPTSPVVVPMFPMKRPCTPSEWSREHRILFSVSAIYVLILAVLFFLLEFTIYLSATYFRVCGTCLSTAPCFLNRVATRSVASSRSLAQSLPVIPSLGNMPYTTSQRSFSDNWRSRLGRHLPNSSFAGSLSNSTSNSIDSGLGFGFRLSTPRTSHVHLNGVSGMRGALNDYVLPTHSATPITVATPVVRSSSQRNEPILDFLGEESVIFAAGGEMIGESQITYETIVVDESDSYNNSLTM